MRVFLPCPESNNYESDNISSQLKDFALKYFVSPKFF